MLKLNNTYKKNNLPPTADPTPPSEIGPTVQGNSYFHKVVTASAEGVAYAEGTSPEGAVPHGQSIRRETALPGIE